MANNKTYIGNQVADFAYLGNIQVFPNDGVPDGGKYVLAASRSAQNITSQNGLYLSNDSGNTFNLIANTSGKTFNGVGMSQTGQYMTAVGDGVIIYSQDYGTTWSDSTEDNPYYALSAMTFTDVYVTKNGQYQILSNLADNIARGLGYVSSNYGALFNFDYCIDYYSTIGPLINNNGTEKTLLLGTNDCMIRGCLRVAPCGSFVDADSSRDDIYRYMVGETSVFGTKGILVNINQSFSIINNGYNFITLLDVSLTSPRISVSTLGQYILVSSSTGVIYFSNDFGTTWTTTNISLPQFYEIFDVAIAGNSKNMYYCRQSLGTGINGQIYKSLDNGISWTLTNAPDKPWYRIVTNK